MIDKILVPDNYDYVGVYLTHRCHNSCDYCITSHHGSHFMESHINRMRPEQWALGLNRLQLPGNIPITLQGGEPFLYKGIWELLENLDHKVDILTALPPHIGKKDFKQLKSLSWNQRPAPYPTIRVSYHHGQTDFKDLVDRVSTMNDLLSIGVYYLDHPAFSKSMVGEWKLYAKQKGVEFRKKEFLGVYKGKTYGEYLYDDATLGQKVGKTVYCKNTVIPVAPDGLIYKCHSDLYFQRKELAIGHILESKAIPFNSYIPCDNYGLCSECDVKVKTNHQQRYGYTSVSIVNDLREVEKYEKE